jgi:hypothetical protein
MNVKHTSFYKPSIYHHRWRRIASLVFLFFIFQAWGQSPAETVRINEFMASNAATLADNDGAYSDWIELYNTTDEAIDLKDWALTDDKANPQKWKFPQVIIDPHNYLVVFASGKDLAVAGQELHTNFKLDGSGEYLAFSNPGGTVLTEFDPSYPRQESDISWAYFEQEYFTCTNPTPGGENLFTDTQILPPPVFSQKRGFFNTPFQVEITSGIASTQIYFTLDGSEPGKTNGLLYIDPVTISTSTVLRAISVKSGEITSTITTHTYLFLADVIAQPNNPPGYPDQWGPYTAIAGNAIADYEMDPEITQDPAYAGLMEQALLSIPTMSLVTDKNNLFSHSTDPDSGGIYIYTGAPENNDIPGIGDGWERPVSLEYFTADGLQ